MSPSIMYYPSDFDGPGSYRCLFPGRHLGKHGWDVKIPAYRRNTGKAKIELELSLESKLADIFVLQQRFERAWPDELIPTLRAQGYAIVADSDDDYVNLPKANPAWKGTHPYRRDDGIVVNRQLRRDKAKQLGWKALPPNRSNRAHMFRAFAACDFLSVSTPHLAEVYSKWHKDITVIRNHLDWDIWADVQPQYEVNPEERHIGGRLRVGYLATFSYRQDDLLVLKAFLPAFLKAHPEVDFVTNETATHDFLEVPLEQRITVGGYDFFTGEEYPVGRMTAVCDIGLVPLARSAFNEGKSHLKGMEYNAAGIPFIASNTESYRYWTRTGDFTNGVIARTASEWREALEQLVRHDQMRREMGAWGRRWAEEDSLQADGWCEWDDFYKRVLGDQYEELSRGAIERGAVQKVSELAAFLSHISGKHPKTVVEIGSARGGSFWAMSQVTADDGLLVSIDIPAGSPIDVRGGKDVYVGRDREKMFTFRKPGQSVHLVDGDSQDIKTVACLMKILDGRTIDVLLIDGDHRYEGVKRDFTLYSPLISEDGIIAFHDIVTHEDTRVGVHRLWGELREHYKTVEYIGNETWGYKPWGGIGVIDLAENAA